MIYLIGIDIGGTNCAVILGQKTGEEIRIVDKTMFPTEVWRGVENILERIYLGIGEIIGKNKLSIDSISSNSCNVILSFSLKFFAAHKSLLKR